MKSKVTTEKAPNLYLCRRTKEGIIEVFDLIDSIETFNSLHSKQPDLFVWTKVEFNKCLEACC